MKSYYLIAKRLIFWLVEPWGIPGARFRSSGAGRGFPTQGGCIRWFASEVMNVIAHGLMDLRMTSGPIRQSFGRESGGK